MSDTEQRRKWRPILIAAVLANLGATAWRIWTPIPGSVAALQQTISEQRAIIAEDIDAMNGASDSLRLEQEANMVQRTVISQQKLVISNLTSLAVSYCGVPSKRPDTERERGVNANVGD